MSLLSLIPDLFLIYYTHNIMFGCCAGWCSADGGVQVQGGEVVGGMVLVGAMLSDKWLGVDDVLSMGG